MLHSSVEHEDYAVAVALLEHFGERIGRDIGTKVTKAQAEATSNAATGLPMSILKPYAEVMTHLHSNEMLPHWAALHMKAVVTVMEKHLYPELDRASIAAWRSAANAVGPGSPGLEAAG